MPIPVDINLQYEVVYIKEHIKIVVNPETVIFNRFNEAGANNPERDVTLQSAVTNNRG